MNSIEQMVAHLRKEVSAFSSRIFPVVHPERGRQWPALVYMSIGGEQMNMLRGNDILEPVIRLDIRAKGYGELMALEKTIREKLKGQPFVAQIPEESIDLYDEKIAVFRRVFNVTLTHS